VIHVKKLHLNKILESYHFALVPRDLIQPQTMTVQIVSQIVKLVQMQYPATLANQQPLRLWHEFCQPVTALLIMQVSQILIVHLYVWLNVRPALTWYLVIFVKKLHLNKIQESYPFALVPLDLIQLQTIIAQIVSRIVKLVQMQYHATLVNLQPHRIKPEFYLFVTVLRVPILLPILIALIVWRIVLLALMELNAPPAKTH
jgi:hypothetical protein